MRRVRPRAWAVTVSVAVLVLSVVGGTLALRSSTVSAFSAAAWRRVIAQRQPATWQESAPPNSVLLNVDATRVLRPISPLIYGVAAAGEDELAATGATINRWGGNPNSRYNWEVGNAWNAARDWEFRNYGADATTPSGPSTAADRFVASNESYGVASLITIPSIGWVARSGSKDEASAGVPAQGGPPVGDGSSGAIAGYDPSVNRRATSVPSFARKDAPFDDPPVLTDGAVFQDEWVAHLVNRFGQADADGVRFYAIDNEPDLWSVTHTDVHPADPNYDDELTSFLDYADAIKDVDPSAQILGPSLSGWTALFYSARDRGTDKYRTHADRRDHGDMPFLPWWLDQVRQHDQRVGRRTLDILDVHSYPQEAGVFTGATDETTNRLRLRSTRSLWDPTYVDESWIGDNMQLIPRLRAWVDQYYPGTKLAIGEWNWGADSTMNGAVAIANVLGIFGREGVDLAAYWTSPHPGSPGAGAFALYTNYDGQGHGFGDVALAAKSSAPDDVQVFASRDSRTGDALLMVVNQRADMALSTTVQLSGMPTARAHMFRLDGTTPDVEEVGPTAINSGALNLVLPAESITLLRIEPS
jgi:hypothetical protein